MLLIKNFTKNKINEKFLRRVEKKAIENIPGIKSAADLEIELAVIGEKRMKSLNRIWRKKDKSTDVLSFESAGGRTKGNFLSNGFKFILPPDGVTYLGQIFICYSVAARQSGEDGYSFDKEMAVLLIHGILHLAGYDHEKSALESAKMFELQEKIAEIVK